MATLWLAGAAGGWAAADGSGAPWPDLESHRVNGIPLSGWDAPCICNHWLWAQAGTGKNDGLLDMEDVRPGAKPQFNGTTRVSVNGQLLKPDPALADWWPNKVVRRAMADGIAFEGTVVAARERYALLNRLVATNTTAQPRKLTLEIAFVPNGGQHATVEAPAGLTNYGVLELYRFGERVLAPGETLTIRAVNVYRADAAARDRLLANFEDEWRASDTYWNELLEDAYTPGPGKFLSGGAPLLVTSDAAARRFYNFGVITTLMLLKRDPDKATPENLYVVALPDADYCTTTYMWDLSYASELLSLMDPVALRTMIERSAVSDPQKCFNLPYNQPAGRGGGRFYAANGSSLFFMAWNYLHATGDYAWLDNRVGERTMLEHLRRAADWHLERPQWEGLAQYGEEANLFDDHTVRGYKHFVAAPNAADVWMNRALADIYEQVRHDTATAKQLRAEADRIAAALEEHLYQAQGEHAGTWKQRHTNGDERQLRHGWDFACAGSFMASDLSAAQKRQMRDWFMQNLVRVGSEDRWIVSQDPRDGNNGEQQKEHNGRGAYPAWPYHAGWALHEMGFQEDVVALLRVIDRVTAMGAIGQGHHPDGSRCRDNWTEVAGGSAAAYLLHNMFDIWPGFGPFAPRPQLAGFDPEARFENVAVRGRLYRVTSRGPECTGALADAAVTVPASKNDAEADEDRLDGKRQ